MNESQDSEELIFVCQNIFDVGLHEDGPNSFD
jgi:hypothetical protein